MALLGKPLDTLTQADLQAFVDNGVGEGRVLDYKLALPGSTDGDKKEFLADVTALANAEGGHVLFGVEEKAGVAVGVPGVDAGDLDAEVLRLDGVIRAGVAPRIPNMTHALVSLANGRHVVVWEVPRSFARPHMVTFKGTNRFYLRHTAGKAPMDIDEIRAAFSLSDTAVERVRQFRRDRINLLLERKGPFPMPSPGVRCVLHLLPLGMFDPGAVGRLERLGMSARLEGLWPLGSGGMDTRFNFDGVASFSPSHNGPVTTYVQTFRSGAIEAGTSEGLYVDDAQTVWLQATSLETMIEPMLPRYLKRMKDIGVQPPILLGLTWLHAAGAVLSWPHSDSGRRDAIDQQHLIVPEVLISSYDENPAEAIRPAFDAVWNAGGFLRSPNYDDHGAWVGRW